MSFPKAEAVAQKYGINFMVDPYGKVGVEFQGVPGANEIQTIQFAFERLLGIAGVKYDLKTKEWRDVVAFFGDDVASHTISKACRGFSHPRVSDWYPETDHANAVYFDVKEATPTILEEIKASVDGHFKRLNLSARVRILVSSVGQWMLTPPDVRADISPQIKNVIKILKQSAPKAP